MRPLLAIETSCDDTSAAVMTADGAVLSSVVSSQVEVHAPYGGVVPELASRHHLTNLPVVVAEALRQAGVAPGELGAVAATAGPGLLGSVLVGLSYGKAAAAALGLPFYPVNHIEAHLGSPWMEHPQTPYPALALVVSGGHTHLFWVEGPGQAQLVHATRDDAAGEALDKVAKRMGLPYPGGPWVDRLSERGDPKAFDLPLPRFTSGEVAYSFSGLKVAALHRFAPRAAELEGLTDPQALPAWAYDLLASFQKRVVDHLLQRIEGAARVRRPSSLVMAGGVACNRLLRTRLSGAAQALGVPCAFPSPKYCTDNAAMVAFAALPRHRAGAPGAPEADAFASCLWPRLPLSA